MSTDLTTDLNALTHLEAAVWDLGPFLPEGSTDARSGLLSLLGEADALCLPIEARRGSIGGIDAPALAELLGLVAQVGDRLGRASSYVELDHSTNTGDEARGALVALVQERATAIGNRILFVDLEWAALADSRARELLASTELQFCAHHLESARAARPYLLSEPEERILAEKQVSSSSAWARLYDETLGVLTVDLGAGPVPFELGFTQLQSADRDARKRAADAITTALEPGLRTRTFIYNTLLSDKYTDDRLRRYPSWISSRNLQNEASDEAVRALIEAVTNRFDIARHWYATKAKLLGVPRLADYDRNADLGIASSPDTIAWSDAVDTVLDSFASFSGRLADEARAFFTGHRVHAPLTAAKRGGAYCSPNVPSLPPYVFVNYAGTRNDVLTLAHELGHGVHFALSRPQGIFHHQVPLTVAETASVFAEEVTFGRLLSGVTAPADRLSLLADHVEGHIATVFRQVAMWRFEDSAHTARRTTGEISTEAMADMWQSTQEHLMGDTVQITPGYRSWWSYIPHFIHVPGYVYAYAFGQLLALSVYQKAQDQGEGFASRYEHLLALGGSVSPEELAATVGCDLRDPSFWDAGLDLVAAAVEEAVVAANGYLAASATSTT